MIRIADSCLLSTAYFPNIQYVSKLLLHNTCWVDIHETFQKQSFRNRCTIFGANGRQDLSIPVVKPKGNQTKTREVLIDYSTKWQLDHWRAIKSAYGNSPFFEIFEPEFAHLFEKEVKFLIDFNQQALSQLFNSLGHDFQLETTHKFIEEFEPVVFNYRDSIHPKKRMQKTDEYFNPVSYFQTFKEKHGFISNLSFIDLVFHEGPQAIDVCIKSISA